MWWTACYVKSLTNQGIHPAQTGSLLSGEHITKGAIIHSGVSVDQVIAAHVGQDTPQSSIVLACEQPMTGFHETNFSLAYSSHLSWQTPDSPVPVEVYPALAWDNLFDNRGSLLNVSVLDRINDQAKSLSTKVSMTDRGKLDEFMTSVREVEKRVQLMRKGMDDAKDAAKTKNTPVAVMERPANGLPEDLREHAKLMCDIIAIAFQTNKTRVASLIISRDLSAMYYPFLDVKEGHHAASHDNASDSYERIAHFHVAQYAYLASKLDSMKEGNGTVLDNSCLMFMSNMFVGRKHDNSRLPLVLAGGLGGTLADRAQPQLSQRRREQAQYVQPVSVADGPVWREAGQVRRRHRKAGADLAQRSRSGSHRQRRLFPGWQRCHFFAGMSAALGSWTASAAFPDNYGNSGPERAAAMVRSCSI